ncbi:hypothetical protein NBRC116188_04450 [Oceaniserpentilla sp. 4NH20-0058]|uniref:hypothetical protein n=1 Tax=Oceaniserpentilla sp. 4NH20-0058 TaxID=3127660 RepID=UPI003101CE5D
MGLCPNDLRHLVIRPTLQYLEQYSLSAETLLLGTAAVESGLGYELNQQQGKGLGVYHINPRTHQLLWDNYLATKPDLASKVRGLASQHEFLKDPHTELTTNLRYATAIAWLIYARKDATLPEASDLPAMAKYWRKHFHSRPQGPLEDYISRYNAIHNPPALSAFAY